jgi:hypothetical protein
MATRIITRLLLLIALAAATALMVGGLSALASMTPDAAAAPRLQRDQFAEVRKSIEASVRKKVEAPAQDATDKAAGATPTPTVVLVFAGMVLMAALPPIFGVHVYQRPYHQRS